MSYQYTSKGRWLIHFLLLLSVMGMLVSGLYILDYIKGHTKSFDEVVHESATNSEPLRKEIVKEKVETSQVPEKQEIQEGGDLYKPYELEDFKNFNVILFFEEKSGRLLTSSEDDLAYLATVLKRYENEPISIEANVNNLSQSLTVKEMESIGTLRIKTVAEYLIEKGISETRIQVKNNYDLKPITLDKGSFHLNDRVTIYFTNHSNLVNDVK